MAGDFVSAAVKAGNMLGADGGPVAGPAIRKPAGDIERSARVVFLKHIGAASSRR